MEARGIYLLVFEDGTQYVGGGGRGGFRKRWMNYAADGHGGNKALKARDARHATVTILEAAGSSATAQEQLWMRKLGRKVLSLGEK